jgi:hypothetical protein
MRDAEQAARITGPISAADPTHRTGVVRVALTGASQSIALPPQPAAEKRWGRSALAGRFVRLLVVGANVQLCQAKSAVTVVLNQATTIGVGSVAAGATFLNGVPDSFRLESDATHLCFISDAGAGFLELYISDQPVP